MPMTSHSSHGHGHGPASLAAIEQMKKGAAAAAAAGAAGGSGSPQQKPAPVTRTASSSSTSASAPNSNPLHLEGERCKSRVPAKVPLTEVNQFLICQLCFGYLIDATAIIECQHAFCKSCILKYLENKNNYCPICEVQLNEAKPHSSLRSDDILQKLVYKLVPGLFTQEVRRRRDFLIKTREEVGVKNQSSATVKENGDGTGETATAKNGTGAPAAVSVSDIITAMDMKDGEHELVFLSPEESVGLSLEYFKSSSTSGGQQPDEEAKVKAEAKKPGSEKQQQLQKQSSKESVNANSIENAENKKQNANTNAKNTCSDNNKANDRRYLQCPAAVSVGLLKKFIRMKYGLSDDYRVDLLYNGDRDSNLENDLTLLDLALIFKWKRADPMCFHYRIFDRPFKPTNTRPGSKRPFSSLMDQEPPNGDGGASTGPSNKNLPPAKLTRFGSSAGGAEGKGSESGTGKTQPKNRSLMLTTGSTKIASEEANETKINASIDSKQGVVRGRPPGLLNLEAAIEESKVKAKLSIDTKPPAFSVGVGAGSAEQQPHKAVGGQKLSVVMPKVPPLIVSSPTRDPSSPLKISFGHISTSPSSKSSSASPEGKPHHHHHHHHHHKHHRHHKEKHRKHSKSKSKDRDKEKGSGSSSSEKSKHKEKRKEEKARAQAQAAAQANTNINVNQAAAIAAGLHVDTKDKETRYKYNAHPNPSQSQTISVKSGKYPPSLLTPAPGAQISGASAPSGAANQKPTAPGAIGKLENIVNKKIGPPAAMKKSAGIFPERRASSSSTASSSSQASLTASLKPKQTNTAKESQARLPDSVHLQVPKSVTLIPVNPNSGQVLGNNKQQQQQRVGQQQQSSAGGGGRLSNATTFTHPLTNKSLHQITVTEVPPPKHHSTSGAGSSSSAGLATGSHKQFNGPGSMEITKIYCDKSSSSNSSTKVFDPQGKKLKGLDISISNANSGNKNTNLGKTGLPKIPGVSILPQSMAKLGKLPKNTISMHAMSISAAGGGGGPGAMNRVKEKHMQPNSGNGNRLSITAIQQQQQQSLLKIPMSNENRKSGEMGSRNMAAPMRRSSSPHSAAGTPPRKLQQQRITPSPPNKLSQLLHGGSQDQIITAKMINRRSSIEITPVGSMNQKTNKIKRPFESTFNKHSQQQQSQSGSNKPSGSGSPPGKREKLGATEKKRNSECPLDLSGKSSRSTPPASSSDYDSSNSSFSTDRPPTPNISITASSPPNHKPNHSSKSSKSHNVAHGTQTISSIAQTLTQKQQQQQQQKSASGNRSGHPGGLTLSPPIISPTSHHSPNSASSPVGSGVGFHPLGNLLTLSNAAAHLRKMNHHNHPLNNLAVAAAASAGGFCPNLLRPPLPQQHSPSSQCLNSISSPPISPNAITTQGLLSHFNHHQMSMSSLMNSPLMQMNSAAAAAAASLLDPTSPASLFCARMGFPQPNPSSPLNPSPNSGGMNPFFPSAAALTRPPHSSPSASLRIPSVSQSSKKSPPMSHSSSSSSSVNNTQSTKSHHSPKSSSLSSSPSKPLKVNGNMMSTSTFVAPSSIAPHSKSQAQSVKNAIPNSMKISNFLPTTKSPSSNANATITSSCSAYENLLMTEQPLGIGRKNEIGSRPSPPESGIKPEPQEMKYTTLSAETSCQASKSIKGKAVDEKETGSTTSICDSASSSLPAATKTNSDTTGSQQAKKNAKYVCSPGGRLKLVSPAPSSAENGQSVVTIANAAQTSACNYEKESNRADDDDSAKLLSSKDSNGKEPQEQDAVITKLHEKEQPSNSGGLGALGIALGLVPRERDDKDQVPLLSSLTGTSSSAPTTTTMSPRTTQQQNLAVRHIPNPSLIFSRNVNTNVTPNNQSPATTASNTMKAEIGMKVKDEEKDTDKVKPVNVDNEIEEKHIIVSELVQEQVVHVKQEMNEAESKPPVPEASVSEDDVNNDEKNLTERTIKMEAEPSEVETKTEDSIEVKEEPSELENRGRELSEMVNQNDDEITKNVDGTDRVVENSDELKEESKPDDLSDMVPKSEPEFAISESVVEDEKPIEAENDDKCEDFVDASSFPVEEQNEDAVASEINATENEDKEQEIAAGDDAMEVEETEQPESDNLELDLLNALVMVNEDDDDTSESQNADLLIKEDSCSPEVDDEINSVGNRTTEDSTSCDGEDMEMEIDSTELEPEKVEGEEGEEPDTEESEQEQGPPSAPLSVSENEESTNAMVLLSVEDIVNQVENDNNNTISVFPTLPTLENVASEEEPMDIDTVDAVHAIDHDSGLKITIPDIVVTDTEPESKEELIVEEEKESIAIQNGTSLSPPAAELENSMQMLPVLSPLTVETTSPQPQSATDTSPPGSSSRPNTLPIVNSPSPINKLSYLKSGSCSPVSPSSVKSGEHNLRKMENLEKVAAGLLATATNINNNTISAATTTTSEPLVVIANTNCDLTISAEEEAELPVPVSNSNTSMQQPPVSNV